MYLEIICRSPASMGTEILQTFLLVAVKSWVEAGGEKDDVLQLLLRLNVRLHLNTAGEGFHQHTNT